MINQIGANVTVNCSHLSSNLTCIAITNPSKITSLPNILDVRYLSQVASQ